MDSDFGVARELSDLQKLRSQYQPELPPCLQGKSMHVEFGDATASADPSGAHTISRSFPHTYGQPLVHFLRATAKVPDAQIITEHPAVRVGVVFCGRQSPGGHNVIWGLHNALKTHNSNSTLLGFLGGSEGLFAQKTLEITDDIFDSTCLLVPPTLTTTPTHFLLFFSSGYNFLGLIVMKKRYRNGEVWDFEHEMVVSGMVLGMGREVILGLDGGTTSTVCICMPIIPFTDHLPDPPPVLARAVAGCSNHNSVGETAARETLEQVMAEALSKSGSTRSAVRAVCLAVSGVNHSTDQQRILNWLSAIFPSHVQLFVENDAVAALASGTLGKLHGCVLIAGTGTIAYGFTEDRRDARASGAGPVLGDWGSGYGIAAQALTAVIRAHDGRGPHTTLVRSILQELDLTSPDELIGWTYADPSWARIAALVPVVVSCAESGDQVANKILLDAVQELASSVKAVVKRLELCGKDGEDPFPLVMVGGVLETNKRWDIGKEVIICISKDFPGVLPIRPKVEPAIGAALLAWNFLMKQSLQDALRN